MEVVEKKEIVHEMDQYPHESCHWHKGYKDYASNAVPAIPKPRPDPATPLDA